MTAGKPADGAALFRTAITTAPAEKRTEYVERFLTAMRAGLRYAIHAPAFLAVLIRTIAFTFFASALWARDIGLPGR